MRKNGSILLVKNVNGDGRSFYTLPGGKQELGESLLETLRRECLEEIGTQIKVGALKHVFEHSKPSKKNSNIVKHKVVFLFECRVSDNYKPKLGYRPDSHQVDVVWCDLKQLSQISFQPAKISSYIKNHNKLSTRIYWGKQSG